MHPYSPFKMWERPSFAFTEPVIVLIMFLPLNKRCVRVLTPSTLQCDLIGHQLFIEAIKSKEAIGVSPRPTLLLSLLKGKFWREICTQGEHHVKMEAEIEVIPLQARSTKDCQQTTRSKGTGPQALRRTSKDCPTPHTGTQS